MDTSRIVKLSLVNSFHLRNSFLLNLFVIKLEGIILCNINMNNKANIIDYEIVHVLLHHNMKGRFKYTIV